PIHHFEGLSLQAHEDARIIFGFTHSHFTAAALQRFFKSLPLVFLKQVHSGRIIQVSGRQSPKGTVVYDQPPSEADGILLTTPGMVAVIQTADCVPLFFYADDFSIGGVIHVGWRGLCQGIEKNLLAMLPGSTGRYSFFLGPAIEKNCYTVGEDLRLLFVAKTYVNDIFYPKDNGKYSMDLKEGLRLSLVDSGISAKKIQDCAICTYCAGDRFPSFRRDGKTGKRIFNFLALK
ncbi:MAG: polyphenol oxidase family protein, partial [Candidatus Aminicenantes bacterium]|nr:polyphenol oxidase family protein [Candidatus Aminicenantes bacterium]